MHKSLRILLPISKYLLLSLFAVAGLITAAFGFGTSNHDAQLLQNFSTAAQSWQSNPDFRTVGIDYVNFSSAGMRATICTVSATDALMYLRSRSFTPDKFKVNDGSKNHYVQFTKGPLSAYLRLCDEQDVQTAAILLSHDLTPSLNPGPTDDQLKHYIQNFKLEDATITTDAGSLQGLRRLINDTAATITSPINPPTDPATRAPVPSIAPALQPVLQSLAKKLNIDRPLNQLTLEDEDRIWQNLDQYLKDTNFDLWRTKQLNDFQAGFWGQVYSMDYKWVIDPILYYRQIARYTSPILLTPPAIIFFILPAYRLRRRRRRLKSQPIPQNEPQPLT